MVRQRPATETLEEATRQPARGPDRAVHRPWWVWLHLLSLDAPVVALAWQDWWSRTVHATLLPGERFVLGFGVWLIYLADRLADVSRAAPGERATARHVFAAGWRWPLLILAVGLAASLVVLSPRVLPAGEFRAGLGLLAAAGVYFWLIHRYESPRWTRRLPKEAVVGAMFALGTVFFALCRVAPVPGSLLVGAVFFGVVCFLNCALITSWERSARDLGDPASLLNAFPGLANGGLPRACWWTAVLASAATVACGMVSLLPVAVSAAALACLDRSRRRLPADGLRCLADMVLLTPWICHGLVAVYQ